ncbi:MAG: hypothetical protein ACPLYD_16540 [Anaerolineae bacterium]
MPIEKSQREKRKWMSTVITFAAASFLLFSCAPKKPAPERAFTTMDLLISLSDMPAGWKIIRGPGELKDYFSTKDSSWIAFVVSPTGSPGRDGAVHRVYRYRSANNAREVYEDLIRPGIPGKTPVGWIYQSPVAASSYFACYDYEGREPYPVCEYAAHYEEYVVVFHSWLIPDYMSLQDIERVIKAIDIRMAQYLGKPLPTQEP